MSDVSSPGVTSSVVRALDQTGAERLRARLHALGFDVVRFARAEPRFGPELRAWLAAGHHADMAWLERGADKRGDPALVLPGARTLVMLGVNYGLENGAPPASPVTSPTPPAWARYARYADYHDTITRALADAGRVLEVEGGIGPGDHRYYVDTGPILERGWAAQAGVGFTGKNAMLISREFGNWLFLAAIVTRLEIPADAPLPGGRRPARGESASVAASVASAASGATVDDSSAAAPGAGAHAGQLCGKCTRCLDACPTQAFAAPGVVDARRCVAYHTIENKGVIPRELRPGIGHRIYGCDTCLEVCPWNRFARASRAVLLTPRPEIARLNLADILALTPTRFAQVFRGTPIKRVKLAGLLRNACVVAGNTGARECVPLLARLADPAPAEPTTTTETAPAAPLVRAHAVWALARLGERGTLARLRERETDALVLAEYAAEGL